MTSQDAPTVQGATTRRYKPESLEDLTETVRVTPEQLSFALDLADDFGTIEPEPELVVVERVSARPSTWFWVAVLVASVGTIAAFTYFS